MKVLESINDSIKGWKSADNPAKVTFKNIINTIRGYIQGSKYYRYIIPKYKLEQVYLRALNSQECLENIHCKSCGCKLPEKLFINEICSRAYEGKTPCYTKFLNKEDWEKLNISKELIEEGKKILNKYE